MFLLQKKRKQRKYLGRKQKVEQKKKRGKKEGKRRYNTHEKNPRGQFFIFDQGELDLDDIEITWCPASKDNKSETILKSTKNTFVAVS